ncbi:MAG: hypothetical protein R2932_47660 [Caldilineaceae bacterium]
MLSMMEAVCHRTVVHIVSPPLLRLQRAAAAFDPRPERRTATARTERGLTKGAANG